MPCPDCEKPRHCGVTAQRAVQENPALSLFRAPRQRLLSEEPARVSGEEFDKPGRTRAVCPILFSFNVAIISGASCASFRTIAWRFRPRAASIAAINSRIDIEIRNQSSGQSGLDPRGIIEAFEHRLRTLRETFTFFIELMQNFQARFFFRQRAFEFGQAFFNFGETLLLFAQCFFTGLGLRL